MLNRRLLHYILLAGMLAGLIVPSALPISTFAQPAPGQVPDLLAGDVAVTHPRYAVPLAFQPYTGRAPKVAFQAQALGGTAFFSRDEVVLALPNPSDDLFAKDDKGKPQTNRDRILDPRRDGTQLPVPLKPLRMRFTQANPSVTITATDYADFPTNLLVGSDPRQWQANAPVASAITYNELYAGIDMAYTGVNGELKRTFTVAPGANPAAIAWTYTGQTDVQLDAAGNLAVAVAQRPGRKGLAKENTHLLLESAPVAWQVIDGEQRPVTVAFAIAANKQVRFAVGAYDPAYALIIDPAISYSTYLSGTGNEWGMDIATDAMGATYVVGYTASVDFPAASGTQSTINGSTDVFVTKYAPAGDRILFSTLLGGTSLEYGMGIDLDSTGKVWIAGFTYSTDFPIVGGAQTTLAGGKDAFAAQLSADGASLLYSSVLGGSAHDDAYAIAVDSANRPTIVGTTYSTNLPTLNAVQTTAGGNGDILVASFDASQTGAASLLYSTYLGGSGDEWGYGVDVDAAGNAYLTGFTQSANLPTASAYQSTFGGDRDGYLLKLASAGTSLLYGTYLGGSGYDQGMDVVVDSNGEYYVGGGTTSTNFPTLAAYQGSHSGGMDAWVTKFSAANSVVFSSYFGGTGSDQVADLALNTNHQVGLAGTTNSTDLPLGPAVQYSNGGGYDGFVTILNPTGSGISNGTYFGGAGDEWIDGLAIDYASNAYITGSTSSANLPIVNAQQAERNGGNEAFVAMIDPDDGRLIANGETIYGRHIQPGTDTDTYYVNAVAGKEITLRMTRTDATSRLNGFLSLASPAGDRLASDNDSGGQSNPKLYRIAAPTTGMYKVKVTDYSGNRTGKYSLSYSMQDPIVPPIATPPPGQEPDPCPVEPVATLPADPTEPVVGPENPSFTTGRTPLPRTTYPLNCEFSRPTQPVSAPPTISFSGNKLALVGNSDSTTSAPFLVPNDTQTLAFRYRTGSVGHALQSVWVAVTITDQSTNASTTAYVEGSLTQGWQQVAIDAKAYVGKSVTVTFTNWNNEAARSEISAVGLQVQVPDWTILNGRFGAVVTSDDAGSHLLLTGNSNTATSTAFNVPAAAQSLRFQYRNGNRLSTTDTTPRLRVDILPASSSSLPIGTTTFYNTALAHGWQDGIVNLTPYQGTAVQVRFTTWDSDAAEARIDRLSLVTETPGWTYGAPAESWAPMSSAQTQIINGQGAPTVGVALPQNATFAQGAQDLVVDLPNADFGQSAQNANLTLTFDTTTLAGDSATATSAPFLVPLEPQSVRLQYKTGNQANAAEDVNLHVWVLTTTTMNGTSHAVKTPVVTLKGSLNAGFKAGVLDLSAFQGQTVQLQFVTWNNESARAWIQDAAVWTEVPGWTVSNGAMAAIAAPVTGHDSAHLLLKNHKQQATSAAFLVPASAQSLVLDYQTDNADANSVYVLSGPSFEYRTRIGGVTGALNAPWNVARFDLQAFQDQAIKLQFETWNNESALLRIDNVRIEQTIPGWTPSNGAYVRQHTLVPPPGGGAYVELTNDSTTLTSAPFDVPARAQTVQFAYWAESAMDSNPGAWVPVSVEVLSGPNFATRTRIETLWTNRTNQWQLASIVLQRFQNRTVKLRFTTWNNASALARIGAISIQTGTTVDAHEPDRAGDGQYLELTGAWQNIQSSAFVVPAGVTDIQFRYQTGEQGNGNSGRELRVSVATDADGYTTYQLIAGPWWTGVQLYASLNDGWKHARIPLPVQYYGQSIKLRFEHTNSDGVLTRIDAITLLDPQETLATPVALTGITYLNVPATELSGPTTPAAVTFQSMIVFAQDITLDGSVSYSGQTYPINLSGDVYASGLGSATDVVGNLIDTSNTFDVINFAIRQQPLNPIADTNLAGQSMALYLQRRGTREITFIDVALSPHFQNPLGTLFSLIQEPNHSYKLDHWFEFMFIDPHTSVNSNGITFNASGLFGTQLPNWTSSTNEGVVEATRVIGGKDNRVSVQDSRMFPHSAVVYISYTTGGWCTGFMINEDTVATAGHCVYDQYTNQWKDIDYIAPGKNSLNPQNLLEPYGRCNAVLLSTDVGWRVREEVAYDYGAIKLDCTVGTTVGWFGLYTNPDSTYYDNRLVRVIGYPKDLPPLYSMWRDYTGKIERVTEQEVFITSDTAGGQSGSAIFERRFDSQSPCGGYCVLAIYTSSYDPITNVINSGTRIIRPVYENYLLWMSE